MPSSTDPSESSPASIRGTSALASAPVVCFTSCITSSRLTVAAVDVEVAAAAAAAAAPDEAPPRPAKALSRAGTTPPRVPRYWPQRTGNSDIADGQTGRSAALKATTPCANPIRPIPATSSRDRMASPAAMPESAHGPHCTLAARKPVSRRRPPSESRQQFAAA